MAGKLILAGRKGLYWFADGNDTTNYSNGTLIVSAVDGSVNTTVETVVDLTTTGNTVLGNSVTADTVTIGAKTIIGTSAVPLTLTTAGNLMSMYQTNNVTTGDVRNIYSKLYLTGASASGEAGRFYTLANAAATSVHGIHATGQVNAGTGVTGELCGVRATLASTTGLTISQGTYAALRLDSDLVSAISTASWIYTEDLQSAKVGNFIKMVNADTSTMYVAAGTSAGSAGDTSKANAPKVLKCMINGATVYIPVYTQNS